MFEGGGEVVAMGHKEDKTRLSIIVPLKNEKPSIEQLIAEIREVLEKIGDPYEIILVDDGSTDGTWETIRALAEEDKRVVALRFRRNCGQTAALSAGFDHSRGEIIIPMDGDLQNDPADIPKMLKKIDEGFDVVSGWRRWRKDSFLTRTLPSIAANKIISFVGQVHLHDYGCTLKAYRRDVVRGVRLYGEMHRFIPIYASWQGARVAEISVNHRVRKHGRSNYNIIRMFKVVLDLMVVKFLADYLHKPIYIFGGVGLFCELGGLAAFLWALYLKLFMGISFIQTPLPQLVVLLVFLGANAFLVGLLAEISVRTYYESQNKTTYHLKESVNAVRQGTRWDQDVRRG